MSSQPDSVDTTLSTPDSAKDAVPFPSFEAVQEAHLALRGETQSATFQANLSQFFGRARATGRLLDCITERSATQAILDYWAVRLSGMAGTDQNDIIEDATLASFEAEGIVVEEPRVNPYLRIHEYLRRDELAARLAARLRQIPVLALLGNDGSGRRSIAREGIFPRLALTSLGSSADWRLIAASLRREPFSDLTRACAPSDEGDLEAFTLREAARLRDEPERIRMFLDNANQPTLLFIFGIDRLFAGPASLERDRIAEALTAVVRPNGPHRLILAVDPSSRQAIQNLPTLGPFVECVDIPPFTAGELRHAIVAPAARIGVRVEEVVVERLLNDVVGDPAAPAFLQFALVQLWAHPERRSCGRITARAYDESGGAQSAFEKTAETFFLSLTKVEQKIVKSVFLLLVAPDVLATSLVVRSLLRRDLQRQLAGFPGNSVEDVLTALEKRFMIRSRDGKHIEPANGRLLIRWARLRQWLNAADRERSQIERLTLDAAQWKRCDEDPSLLWKGTHLANAWEELRREGLSELELRFLTEGRRVEASEQARWQKRTTYFLATLVCGALLALIAVGLSIWIGKQRREAAVVINEGSKSLEAGDPAAAAVLFAAAVEKVFPMIDNEDVHRTRLAAALRQVPRLVARLPHPMILQEQFHPREPDLLVTVGGDRLGKKNFAAFWNLNTGQVTRLSAGEVDAKENVNHAEFSPASQGRGGIIATAHGSKGSFGEVRLWSIEEALMERATPLAAWCLPARVSRLAFSPDGSSIAIVLEHQQEVDSEVRVYRVEDQAALASTRLNSGVNHLAFNSAGDLLAIACGNLKNENYGEALLWEFRAHRLRELVHEAPVNYLEFSPEGSQLITACGVNSIGGEGRIWDISTGNPLAMPAFSHRDNVTFASFSPDGERVATASRDNTSRIWSRKHGFKIAELRHDAGVLAARFSADGQHLLTASRDRRARVWKTKSGELALPPLDHSGTVARATFSADGRHVLAGGQDEARLWRLETGNREIMPLQAAGPVRVAALSSDGTLAATATESCIELWMIDGTRSGPQIKVSGNVESLTFMANNPRLVVVGSTSSGGGFASVYDIRTQAAVRHREFQSPVTFAAAAHNAPLLLLAIAGTDSTGEAVRWNLETDEIHRISAPASIAFAAFAPNDQSFVIAGGSDSEPSGYAQVWETAAVKPLAPPVRHLEKVTAAAFNYDGSLIATASVDDTARVWSARDATSKSKSIRRVHTADVQAVAFSPDGDAILTGSYDGTAACVKWKQWNDGDATPVFRHQGAVNVVAFSSDGKRILTASDDGTARVWERSTGNLIALLRHGEEVRAARLDGRGQSLAVLASSRPPLFASKLFNGTREPSSTSSPDLSRRAELQRWQLTPEDVPMQTLVADAEVLANATVHGPARLTPLNPPIKNRPLKPERISSQSNEAHIGDLPHHLAKAAFYESAQRWFAAAWHLGRAIECGQRVNRPPDELRALQKRRGDAYYNLRRWADAVQAYTDALSYTSNFPQSAEHAETYMRRIWARIQIQDFSPAIEECQILAQLWPNSHDPWTFLAAVHLEQDLRDDVRKALLVGIQREPNAITPWQRLAAAELWYSDGDTSRYRAACEKMWSQFKDVKSAAIRLAWPCCLSPASGVDPTALVTVVEQALENRTESYFDLNTYGAVLLRAGRLDDAITVLDRSRAAYIKAGGSQMMRFATATAAPTVITDGRPQDWVLLALAWSKKGDIRQANHWLRKVDLFLEPADLEYRAEASTIRSAWNRLELQTLRREAAASINESTNGSHSAGSAF